MKSAVEKERVSAEVEVLLELLTIEDASEILTIQMAAVIAQGSDSQADAEDFLDDVRRDISHYLSKVDFAALAQDEDVDGSGARLHH